ncbi:MAG: FmdB family zinc ribbon protein [Halothiobacillus sp.]|nr:zinc ribbon domain-containing protein [Halothiobacillus sp.]
MPIYDYRCRQCHHGFETLVMSGETPVCPSCHSDQLEKLVSLPAPSGKSAGIIARARAQASREGHFSNYDAPERKG